MLCIWVFECQNLFDSNSVHLDTHATEFIVISCWTIKTCFECMMIYFCSFQQNTTTRSGKHKISMHFQRHWLDIGYRYCMLHMYRSCVLLISHYSLPIHRRLDTKTAQSLIWSVCVCVCLVNCALYMKHQLERMKNETIETMYTSSSWNRAWIWAAFIIHRHTHTQNAPGKLIHRYLYI